MTPGNALKLDMTGKGMGPVAAASGQIGTKVIPFSIVGRVNYFVQRLVEDKGSYREDVSILRQRHPLRNKKDTVDVTVAQMPIFVEGVPRTVLKVEMTAPNPEALERTMQSGFLGC